LPHFPEVKHTNIVRQHISDCGETQRQRVRVKAHRGL